MSGSPWKRNENGTYQRPTDDIEHSMAMMEANAGGTFHLCITTNLFFADSTNVEHRLRQAWKRFGVKNPHVTAAWKMEDLANSSFIVTPLDTEAKLEQWATETFTVDNGSENADQLARHPPNDRRGLLTWVAKSQQLVLQITHCACDLYGAGYAFSEILDSTSKGLGPPADLTLDEPSLVPTALEGFGLPTEKLQWNDVRHIPMVQEGLNLAREGLDCATVPKITTDTSNPTYGFDGAMEFYELELTEDETARVVARAKELGVTMGTYLYASASKAMQGYDHNDPQAKFATAAVFNRRPHFDHQRWDKPLGEFGLVWPISIDIYDKSFPEMLDQVREYMARYTPVFRGEQAEREEYHSTRVAGACDRALLELLAHYTCPFLWLLSSVGVFDPYLAHQYGQGTNKIIVEDWNAYPRSTMPGKGTTLSTWGGKLRIHSFWNSEFHDRAVMTQLADKFKDAILFS